MVKKLNNKNYKKGRLILEEIRFDHVFKREVKYHSPTSGRIYLPKELVDKTVYVVIDAKGEKE